MIWCTNYPNVHIRTFYKSWNFVWGCFFNVNILKYINRIRDCFYHHNFLIFFYFHWFCADVRKPTVLYWLIWQNVFRKVVKMMIVFGCVIFLWLGFSCFELGFFNFLKKHLEEDNSNFFEIILPLPHTNISVTEQRNVQMPR